MQFQRRVGTHVEDDVDDAQNATERLKNREVEVEDDMGVRDHQRLVLMGRIAHKIPTVMKRGLRTKSRRVITKHLRWWWWWWEVPKFKIKKKRTIILLLLVGIEPAKSLTHSRILQRQKFM